MPNPSRPAVAVVVPATDDPPDLPRCLRALEAARGEGDEIIVVDAPAGGGPAAARNRGSARTRADVVAFVDADVEVHRDALERLRAAFDRDHTLAAVFGSYDDRPAAAGAVSRFRNLLHHHVHSTSGGPASTFWAGLGAVRRGELEAIGGFDEGRFDRPSVEDIELGMRLHDAGRRILLDPAIRGTHRKRWSVRTMVRTDFADRGVPWARLLLERGRAERALNLSLAHRASALASVAAAASLVARRPRVGAVALAFLVALNRDFYALLARRGGAPLLAVGIPLHVLHHLTAAAAGVTAVALHARARRG